MTRGLSVEDDKGVCHSRAPSVIPAKAGIYTNSFWIPHQVRDVKECVIPVKTGIQSVISGSPIRSASLSVEDDKGVSFPQKRESSLFVWIPHQVRDDGRGWIPHQVRDDPV